MYRHCINMNFVHLHFGVILLTEFVWNLQHVL